MGSTEPGLTPAPPTPTATVPSASRTAGTSDPTPTIPAEPEGNIPPAEPEGSWDKETRAYITKLRTGEAKWRKKTRILESSVTDLQNKFAKIQASVDPNTEPADPKIELGDLQAQNDQLVARNAILEIGIENKIPAEKMDYFAYKVEKAAADLDEGEELDAAPIVDEVMRIGSSEPAPGVKTKPAQTGTTPGKTPTPQDNKDLTVDKFKKMGFLAKSELQRSQPEVYEVLKNQALESTPA